MRHALAALLLALPADAADDPYYPAAQCAAFWFGRDDYARHSAYLDVNPSDAARADAFRSVAVRQNGGDAAPIDAFLRIERRVMALTIEAFIYGNDAESRGIHDRLLQTCEDFAATQAETRDLR